MIAEVGELPPEISATIAEDPATVEAQIDDISTEVRRLLRPCLQRPLYLARWKRFLQALKMVNSKGLDQQ